MTLLVAANARDGKRVRPNALLYPGASWTGTAGSGGTAPVEDATVRGSGWTGKAIGRFDEPSLTYMTDDLQLTVGADHGDTAWISDVLFWCEGRTQTVTSVSKSGRTGAIGFACTLDNTSFTSDGDAQVYAYIRPVNGFERRIGPITVTRMQDASRPLRYLSTTGSDSNDGLTAGTAWRTMNKACVSGPSGALVYCAAGRYNEDSNAGTLNNNARPIEFRPSGGTVTVGQSSLVPSSFWQPRAKNVIYNGLSIDLTNVAQFWGASPTGVYTFKGCTLADANGVTSGYDNWPGVGDVQISRQINTESQQTPFRPIDGQENNLLESSLSLYVVAGWTLIRNSTMTCASDAVFVSAPPAKTPAVFNAEVTQAVDNYEQRRHLAHTLTIASVSYAAGTVTNPDGVTVPGKTTITWNESTTFDSVTAGGQPMQNFRFLTGVLTGQQFAIYSQNSAGTTVLYGDCRAAVAGDSARGYIVWHADALQLAISTEASTNPSNMLIQRYKAVGSTFQVLWQAGSYTGQGTISTTGTALTCSTNHNLVLGDYVRPSTGGQSGEWRRVTDVPTTTTATLDTAFSVNQSAVTWRHSKSIRNSAVQLSVVHKTVPSSILHQWQHGHDHFVWRQNTLLGHTLTFRNVTTFLGTSQCVIRDCILESVSRDDAGTSVPTGATIDNNQFKATSTVTGTNSTTGDPLVDIDYRPTVAVRTTTPKLRWNQKGEALAATANVGAL